MNLKKLISQDGNLKNKNPKNKWKLTFNNLPKFLDDGTLKPMTINLRMIKQEIKTVKEVLKYMNETKND